MLKDFGEDFINVNYVSMYSMYVMYVKEINGKKDGEEKALSCDWFSTGWSSAFVSLKSFCLSQFFSLN